MRIPVMTTYGLTEMGSVVTLASTPVISEDGTVSLGLPLAGREIRLSADGEVLTRGETRFNGYITSEGLCLPCDQEGWFATGDIAELLPDGTLAIIGRRDAQFISGGENIHPEMVENALTSLPGILAACVVPIPNDEFGHRPFAFVVSEGVSLDLNEIREALRPLIPSFALPIGIQEAPEELLTPTGKISRSIAVRAGAKR
jgi:O-succinylbenzoic acid--CoA ligase